MNDEERIARALERYREGTVGMRGAAALAGFTLAEMMAETQARDLHCNIDPDELEHDVDALE